MARPKVVVQPGRRVEDGTGWRAWMARPARRVVVETLFLVVIVTVVLTYVAFKHQASRLDRDEAATCHIQQRGLPASHDLAELVRRRVLPVADQTPPLASSVDRRSTRVIADEYLRITGKQPMTRRC